MNTPKTARALIAHLAETGGVTIETFVAEATRRGIKVRHPENFYTHIWQMRNTWDLPIEATSLSASGHRVYTMVDADDAAVAA